MAQNKFFEKIVIMTIELKSLILKADYRPISIFKSKNNLKVSN